MDELRSNFTVYAQLELVWKGIMNSEEGREKRRSLDV